MRGRGRLGRREYWKEEEDWDDWKRKGRRKR